MLLLTIKTKTSQKGVILKIMRVVLPSNASMKHFPNNSLSRYTVKLPQPIDLTKGKWEVGLIEIAYSKSWYNVTEASLTIKYQGKNTAISIPNGYYKSMEEFCKQLNETFELEAPKTFN